MNDYDKYMESPFFEHARGLCPYEHPDDMFCAVCMLITEALAKTYEKGRADERKKP